MEKQRRLHYKIRQRVSALVLSVLMVLSNIGFSLATVYGAENSSDITFLVAGSELVRSVQDAVSEGQEVQPEDIGFTNGKVERFQNLFFGSGRLYEVYPEFEEDGGRDAELRIFVRLTEEDLEKGTESITGDEELIFLYLNHTDETITCQTEVTRRDLQGEERSKKFGRVTLRSYESAYGEEEVDIVTDGGAELATPSEPECADPEPEEQPAEEPETTPEEQPTEEPETMPEEQPAEEPETMPEEQPAEEPETMPEEQPAEEPETTPEEQPAEEPETTPEEQPAEEPETSEAQISYHEAPLTETALEIATPSETSDPEKEEQEDLSAPRDNDLAGVDWCSTAKVRITTLNELKAFEDVTGYLVDYFVEPDEDLAKVKGPEVVEEGESLRFSVFPKRGARIETVTVNGEEILPVEEATPSETGSSRTSRERVVYIVPELDEDAEVVIEIQEQDAASGAAEIVGGASYESIQEAVTAAKDGDTIRLLTDVGGESIEITGQDLVIDLDGYMWTGAEEGLENGKIYKEGASVITVTDSALSIIGMGTIQATQGYRAITAEDTDLTIGEEGDEEGPEIRGSKEAGTGIVREKDSQKGGVILADGGSVTLNSGAVTEGYVTAEDEEASPSEYSQSYGGGIAVLDGVLTMNGGSITGNTVGSGNGGGIYITTTESIKINGGEISENQAEDGLGGGIYLEGCEKDDPAELILEDVTIRDNTAKFGGGAAAGNYCSSLSITENTKTYENQAIGDAAVGETDARISDEFLICGGDTALSDEFAADAYSAFAGARKHAIQTEESEDLYILSLGGESAYDPEATGYYNQVRPDGLMEYQLQDTLYYEDDNILVAFHIEGTATAAGEEMIGEEETPVATPSEASAQKGLVLEAEPVAEDQPEYKAVETYAQTAGGEEGVVGLSAMELNFYCQDQLLDVSACSITAEITPKEPVMAAARKAPAVQTMSVRSNELENTDSANTENTEDQVPAIALTALESDGEKTMELGKVTIAENENTAPVLTVSMNSSEPKLLVAVTREADPEFTVQYYANLDVVQTGDGGQLTVIDTSNGGNNQGGKLPKNGQDPATKNIILNDAGNGKYQVATAKTLTEVYQTRSYQFTSAPGLEYFNALQKNGNYTLKEVWVLKDGGNSTSTNASDWTIYNDPASLTFTNNAGETGANTVVIKKNTVIRLVYDPTSSGYTNAVNFYDYNITDDRTTTWDSVNGAHGINSSDNYSGSGNKLAFGNANTGTGLSNENWNGNTLNQYNHSGNGYLGCTFGLVTGLDENGYLQYANGVTAPKLFNDGYANGKVSYENGEYTLQFNRAGDTYTLSAVNRAGLSGLEYFNHPQCGDKVHDHIWTNNFWPMDSKPSTDGKTGYINGRGSYSGYDGNKLYPLSDDGIAHNNMFGMQYAVKFNLSADYTGPLEYYFFGDDDMWVFLDGKLVCDIGGVHSSVGQYVNLWDYLTKGSEGEHTLTFFYTERGLSGSSCYMQFTLPSVTSATPGQKTGSLTVQKKLVDGADEENKGEEFTFTLNLEDGAGAALANVYPYESSNGGYGSIGDGGTFTLKAGESITVSGLPYGTTYTIEEAEAEGYTVSYEINGEDVEQGRTATGEISEDLSDVRVVYTNKARPKLPETGGRGTLPYALGGMALMILPPMYKFRRKRIVED